MTTDLAQHIQVTPLIDSHEHLYKEADYVHKGPDVLADLFGVYIGDDLMVAGAPLENVTRLLDSGDPDIEARWAGVQTAWQSCQHTGYGEAVRYMARLIYGMDDITLETIERAAQRNREIRQPGERLRLLREVANPDHVGRMTRMGVSPDQSGPEFSCTTCHGGTLQERDLMWQRCNETGIAVVDLVR
jgi:hypothetical protein